MVPVCRFLRTIPLPEDTWRVHANAPEFKMPSFAGEERETILGFLDWKRAAVLHTARDLTDEQARWTPESGLLPIAGIIHHLTCVEARWIAGRYLSEDAPVADADAEFGTRRPLDEIIAAYCDRRVRTNEIVRAAPTLDEPCTGGHRPLPELRLRWALLHVLDETCQHAGHADATRELLDGQRST